MWMKVLNQKMKFRDKIMYYSIITMLVVHLSFIFYFQSTIENVTINEAEISTQKNMAIVGNSMDFMFVSVKSKVAEISIDADLVSKLHAYYDKSIGISTLRRQATDIINQNIGISNIITGVDIVLNDNRTVHTSPIKDREVNKMLSDNFSDDDYQAYVWHGPINLQHYNGINEYYFVIKKKIVDVHTAKDLGILYIYVSESDFRQLYESVFDTKTNRFIIAKKDGTIVSAADKALIGTSLYDAIQMHGESLEQNLTIRNENDEFIISNQVGDKQFHLVGIKKNVELEEASSQIRMTFVWSTLIYIVLIFIVYSFISKQLTLSLNDLVAVMRRIKKGERSLRVNLASTDEFQLLGQSFNDLMDANEALVADIYDRQEEIRRHELRALNEQIKPHFLYNTLGSVSSLIKLDMHKEAIDAVQSLAAFFRVFLNEGNDIYTLADEIKMIESYLTIQRYRYQNILGFSIDIEPEILTYSIPKLLLQPLVENAIYHGVKSRNEKTMIEVTSQVDRDIVLVVRDFGKGMDQDKVVDLNEKIHLKNHHENFGLRSVNQRIQLKYGNDYGLKIESEPDKGTTVFIRLPREAADV